MITGRRSTETKENEWKGKYKYMPFKRKQQPKVFKLRMSSAHRPQFTVGCWKQGEHKRQKALTLIDAVCSRCRTPCHKVP